MPHTSRRLDDDGLPQSHDDLIDLLGNELALEVQASRRAPVPITEAQVDPAGPGRWTCRLRLAMPVDVTASGLVSLGRPGSDYLRGEVADANRERKELTVVLAAGRQPTIPPGSTVSADTSWITAALAASLRRRREEPINSALLRLLRHNPFMTGEGRALSAEEDALLQDLSHELNEVQGDAVGRALREDVFFLWGPPGTGKTFTLAALVWAHTRLGNRVLVLSPSNAATDVLATAIARRFEAVQQLDPGTVLRLGLRAGAEFRTRYGSRCTLAGLQRIVPDRSAPVAHSVLNRCSVAVAPVSSLYVGEELIGDWDVVVLDEASMINLPQAVLAAATARHRLVIAGDFMQLPPAATAPATIARTPSLSAFLPRTQRVILEARDDQTPRCVGILTEQMRMARPICALVSAFAYAGEMRGGAKSQFDPIWGRWVVVDTGSLGPRAEIPAGTQSRLNTTNLNVAAQLVRELRVRHPEASIRVVTAYVEQSAALKRAHDGGRLDALVRTIHRGQGGESDIVVLLLDDAQGAAVSKFFSPQRDERLQAQLLTVAVSRAREQCLIVADVKHLRTFGGAPVQKLLELAAEHGTTLEARDLFPDPAARALPSPRPSAA